MFGEGSLLGKPAKLNRFQRRVVWRWYEYHPGTEDGRGRPQWRFDSGFISIPSGEGKTQLAGWIEALEFAGPPQIAPLNPIVIPAAASLDNANRVYRAFALNFGGPDDETKDQAPLAHLVDVFDLESTFKSDAGRVGRVQRIASVASTNEGDNPTLFVGDELHEWVGSKARLWFVQQKSIRKANPPGRMLAITTAGVRGSDTLCEQTYQHALKVRRDQSVDPTLMVEIHEAADHWDLDDRDQVRSAVLEASPSRGAHYDVDGRVSDFFRPTMPRHEAERYYLNRWVDSVAESWLDDMPRGHWASLQADRQIPHRAAVHLAVDMALRHDSMALGLVWPADVDDPDTGETARRLVVRSHVWTPTDGKLPHDEMWQLIRWIGGALYDVKSVAYDPRYFELPAQQLEDEGYLMVEMPQTPERMSQVSAHAYELIGSGVVEHDGDPTLAAHVQSAAKKITERGWMLSKSRSKRHIDACVAMCMGLWEASRPADAPKKQGFAFVMGGD